LARSYACSAIANSPQILDPVQVNDASPNDDDSRGRWCLKNISLPITTLVVTLPDPVNSHLSLDFDRRIAALQSAALDAQYVLDQFWLPWDGAAASGTEDGEKAGKDRVLRRLRQNQPGLQIFRSRDFEHPKALFVFVVSETPTQGVRLSQFENAITYVREVQNAARQSTTSTTTSKKPRTRGSFTRLLPTERTLAYDKQFQMNAQSHRSTVTAPLGKRSDYRVPFQLNIP